MKNNCILSILNKQIIDTEKNNIKILTMGCYKKINNKYYIIYNEYPEDSLDKLTVSILKIESSDYIILTKSGSIQSKLMLEKGKRHYCQYQTEFGDFTLGIYTKTIEYNFRQNSGNIYIKYFLDINSTLTATNEIFINIKENK